MLLVSAVVFRNHSLIAALYADSIGVVTKEELKLFIACGG